MVAIVATAITAVAFKAVTATAAVAVVVVAVVVAVSVVVVVIFFYHGCLIHIDSGGRVTSKLHSHIFNTQIHNCCVLFLFRCFIYSLHSTVYICVHIIYTYLCVHGGAFESLLSRLFLLCPIHAHNFLSL